MDVSYPLASGLCRNDSGLRGDERLSRMAAHPLPSPLPSRDVCATSDVRGPRCGSVVSAPDSTVPVAFGAVSRVRRRGRTREEARASDAGLGPRRGVGQLHGPHDVVHRALEQQLRLSSGQPGVARPAVAERPLEVAEDAFGRHPPLRDPGVPRPLPGREDGVMLVGAVHDRVPDPHLRQQTGPPLGLVRRVGVQHLLVPLDQSVAHQRVAHVRRRQERVPHEPGPVVDREAPLVAERAAAPGGRIGRASRRRSAVPPAGGADGAHAPRPASRPPPCPGAAPSPARPAARSQPRTPGASGPSPRSGSGNG